MAFAISLCDAVLSAALAHWVRDHHGIISSSQLEHLGITSRQRQALLADGLLEAVHEGVYRCAALPLTFESVCAAVCAADTSLVIACTSAARTWRWRRCTADPSIHALTTRGTRPVGGIVVHRTRDLPSTDVIGWTKLVAQHCIWCARNNPNNIHYNWQFLPWHRALLYFLEYQSGGVERRFAPSLYPRRPKVLNKR